MLCESVNAPSPKQPDGGDDQDRGGPPDDATSREPPAHARTHRSALAVATFTIGVLGALTGLTGHRAAHAQTTEPAAAPDESVVARLRVALVVGMRGCLPTDGWTHRLHVVVARGRLTAAPPAGETLPPDAARCLQRAAARVRVRTITPLTAFETDIVADGRDPRPDLLRTIDVAGCLPTYDHGSCYLNAAVSVSARRPQRTNGVVWDVQGCIPTAEQLACVETRIGMVVWPVNARDAGSFRGRVGHAPP